MHISRGHLAEVGGTSRLSPYNQRLNKRQLRTAASASELGIREE
jgi:hypothetical protein